MTCVSCLKSGVVLRLTLGEKLGVKGMRCTPSATPSGSDGRRRFYLSTLVEVVYPRLKFCSEQDMFSL